MRKINGLGVKNAELRISYQMVVFQRGGRVGSINGTIDPSQDVYYVINLKIRPTVIAIIQAQNRVV